MTEQQAIKAARGWHETLPLPKQHQAEIYRRVLRGLGYQTRAPEERQNGYVVKFRARMRGGRR